MLGERTFAQLRTGLTNSQHTSPAAVPKPGPFAYHYICWQRHPKGGPPLAQFPPPHLPRLSRACPRKATTNLNEDETFRAEREGDRREPTARRRWVHLYDSGKEREGWRCRRRVGGGGGCTKRGARGGGEAEMNRERMRKSER